MKILLVQTASLGDVVLATSAVHSLKHAFPEAEIHFVCKHSTADILRNHPWIHTLWVWDKSSKKLNHLLKLIFSLRKHRFDAAITFQRYFSSAFLLLCIKANKKALFSSNFLSYFFKHRIQHVFIGKHETERNWELLKTIFPTIEYKKPILFPLIPQQSLPTKPFITIFPGSLWETKRTPLEKWIELIRQLPSDWEVLLLGSKADNSLADFIKKHAGRESVHNWCGQLSLLEIAYVMKQAQMNYSNDSAPTHIASAVDAPVTTVYCSTIPAFGFYPISSRSFIVEPAEKLDCRPCNNHGKRNCPLKHFHCGNTIDVSSLLKPLKHE